MNNGINRNDTPGRESGVNDIEDRVRGGRPTPGAAPGAARSTSPAPETRTGIRKIVRDEFDDDEFSDRRASPRAGEDNAGAVRGASRRSAPSGVPGDGNIGAARGVNRGNAPVVPGNDNVGTARGVSRGNAPVVPGDDNVGTARGMNRGNMPVVPAEDENDDQAVPGMAYKPIAFDDEEMGVAVDEEEEDEGFPAVLYDCAEALVVGFCSIVLVFTLLVRLAVVSGSSMEQTLYQNDILIVSDIAFEPKYGDIVVFQKLGTWLGDDAVVKRVIATEGQTVDINFETWTVTVDGEVIDESKYLYLARDAVRTADIKFPITLGEGELFVMGDNRNHSTDSRFSDMGVVDERTVFGRVIMRVFPLNEFKIFGRFE